MKTIRFPRPLRSYGVALVVSGLQFLSVFPNSVQAEEHQNLFGWTNLQSDIAGVADRTDPNLVNLGFSPQHERQYFLGCG
jgi:hypothetical protein